MVTYLCMSAVLLFLCVSIVHNARFLEDNLSFFDKDNTIAMRGGWSIVIILVHIPALYQNRIQDMIGSFAYVGVTFFFMVSAYGLKTGIRKDPDSLDYFWKRRLPKLLIPVVVASIAVICIELYCGNKLHLIYTFNFSEWVKWLLLCYFFFWIVYKDYRIKHKDMVISAFIVIFSLFMYFIRNYYWTTTWTTEIYGFIWGLLLADQKEKFKELSLEKWSSKLIGLCFLALGMGIIYLKCKPVYFWGEYLVKIILGFSILLFILHITTRIKIGNPLIDHIGQISFAVFLSHGAIMTLLAKFFPNLNSGVFIVLTIILTIILSEIVNRISNRLIKLVQGVISQYG